MTLNANGKMVICRPQQQIGVWSSNRIYRHYAKISSSGHSRGKGTVLYGFCRIRGDDSSTVDQPRLGRMHLQEGTWGVWDEIERDRKLSADHACRLVCT